MPHLLYSVVLPVFNECESVGILLESILKAMDSLNQEYEILAVDDGSDDGTRDILNAFQDKHSVIRYIPLPGRMGKSEALQRGFNLSKGSYIITMDSDLQNDPSDIPGFIAAINKGADVVCGIRSDRKDPLNKIIQSKTAVFFRKALTGEKVTDVCCPFRMFRKECVRDLVMKGADHRFFTLIMKKRGYKMDEIPVKHHPRKFGISKFGIRNRLLTNISSFIRIINE